MKRILVGVLPFLAWCLLTWRVSAESDPDAVFSVPFPVWDKLAHFVVYAAGGALAFRMMSLVPRWPRAFSAVSAALVLCTAWGVLDEVHQSFVPGRSSDAADVVADACGAAAGAWGMLLVTGWRTARRLARASR